MIARVLLGCVVACVLAIASLAEEPKDIRLKPTLTLTGSHSAILKDRFEVISNETDWKKLWKEHRGDVATRLFAEGDQTIDLDFDTHYVVAIFYGHSPTGTVTPRQRGDTIHVGFKNGYYQIAGGRVDERPDTLKAQETTTAHYAFIVLPKPVKAVVIERDIQRELGKPPLWEEQKRFPAPKNK